MAWNVLWKGGALADHAGRVHVSMNDYLIHRLRDIPRVAMAGMQLRSAWPRTEGTLGLWFASFRLGKRQVSVSIWRSADDLKNFVRSPVHGQVMRDFKDAGALFTNAWKCDRFDRHLIWQQAIDRLTGGVEGVSHHSPAPSHRRR